MGGYLLCMMVTGNRLSLLTNSLMFLCGTLYCSNCHQRSYFCYINSVKTKVKLPISMVFHLTIPFCSQVFPDSMYMSLLVVGKFICFHLISRTQKAILFRISHGIQNAIHFSSLSLYHIFCIRKLCHIELNS
ncbi:hypothetical protein Peur_008525 [Populus x canadensis]